MKSRWAGVTVGCTALAAAQKRLFTHHGAGDDRAPHPVALLDVDCVGAADLCAGAAADAQFRRPREIEVCEPVCRGVGHAARADVLAQRGDLGLRRRFCVAERPISLG
jgi:hypothetical protein